MKNEKPKEVYMRFYRCRGCGFRFSVETTNTSRQANCRQCTQFILGPDKEVLLPNTSYERGKIYRLRKEKEQILLETAGGMDMTSKQRQEVEKIDLETLRLQKIIERMRSETDRELSWWNDWVDLATDK